MKIQKNDIPVRIDVDGATARQVYDFGDVTGYEKLAGEYFTLSAGVDFAPLLKGLENDLCQSPHWGYLIKGEAKVTYTNGDTETVSAGDLFYWPPGHNVKVDADADIVMFSPQHEHSQVIDHILEKIQGEERSLRGFNK